MKNITLKPNTLKTLRKNRGIPVEVLAQKLKLTEDKYETYEKQPIEVSVQEANKIAKIFNRNWTVFLLENPPEKPNFDHDNRTNRLQTSGIGYKTYDALEEANYLLDFILSISEDNENKIPQFSDDIPATALASNFRQSVKLSFDKQPEFKYISEALNFWISVMASLGINVSRFPLGDNDGVRAFSIYKSGRAIIVLNSLDSDGGKLFSLFHELGHILRRNTGLCDLHDDNAIETYCNNFASEMLIPQTKFDELMQNITLTEDNILESAGKIANKVKSSRLAALTKFLKAGLITQTKYDELYKQELKTYQEYRERQKSNSNAQINPYALKRSRVGRLFTNEIFDALHQSRISPFEASNYLGFSAGKLGTFNEWVAKHEAS